MKIAVYTIALNECKFVDSWYNSAKDADYLLIADTGSTDGTADAARTASDNDYRTFQHGVLPSAAKCALMCSGWVFRWVFIATSCGFWLGQRFELH